MIKKQIIMAIFLLAITIRLSLADPVMFNFKNEDLNGNPLKLTSILKKPDGNGPFPAIVLLHGCGGINEERDAAWVERLVKWGYVTLQVDSLSPRDETNICESSSISARFDRMPDAYGSKSYLENLSFVDDKRIAVMG